METGMKLLGIRQISAPSCFLQKGSGASLWLPGASWGDSIRASQAWNQSLTPIKGCPAPPLWLSHLGLSTLSRFIFLNYMQLCVHLFTHLYSFLQYSYLENEMNLTYPKLSLVVNAPGSDRRFSVHRGSLLLHHCLQPSTACMPLLHGIICLSCFSWVEASLLWPHCGQSSNLHWALSTNWPELEGRTEQRRCRV